MSTTVVIFGGPEDGRVFKYPRQPPDEFNGDPRFGLVYGPLLDPDGDPCFSQSGVMLYTVKGEVRDD